MSSLLNIKTFFNNQWRRRHALRYFCLVLIERLAKMPWVAKVRSHGRLVAALYDLWAVNAAWILAYWVVIDTMADMSVAAGVSSNFISSSFNKMLSSFILIFTYWKPILWDLVWIVPVQLLLFRMLGLYRGLWRFASLQDLRKILYASLLGCLAAWAVLRANTTGVFFGMIFFDSPYLHMPSLSSFTLLPRHIIAILYGLFLISLLSSARLLVRFAKNAQRLYGDLMRVIIVGAGNAGEGLVRDLLRDNSHHYQPIFFVDDDLKKMGREIHGVRVAGSIAELPYLIKKHYIHLVLIAIPSASSARMRSVFDLCEKADVRCYTLPGIKDLANGRVSINTLRSISLEDLLGRFPVACQWTLVKHHLQNKTVLITGGGGSIGSELCRQMAAVENIKRLIIVDNNEYNLYRIDMELREKFPGCTHHSVLLDVTDQAGIKNILNRYKPNFIFHAAAYKHVPLLESQPRVAIYNNIIGTCHIAEEAIQSGVDTFVLISTDKAVNPTNIMGATKRAGEYFCQNLNDHARQTRFITVRFGNVLDSAGSVVPLFRKQIEAGGPVTVTHPDICRFFMTIPEASQLILQAAILGQGGEIFVLDMGEPIKIRYLAEQMIKLAGKIVGQDIAIAYTGLRPGEKLFEEYFYPTETLKPTLHAKILRAVSSRRDFLEIKAICLQLQACCKDAEITEEALIDSLKKLVPEYHPMREVYPYLPAHGRQTEMPHAVSE